MSSCLCVRRRWDEAPRLASPAAMPEVWDLAGALPEVSVNPITGVGVVASRKRAPFGYCVSHLGNVLVDMRLIDAKDTLPVGFIAIQETADTQERTFRKRRLCVKFIPRDSTEMAICDVQVLGKSRVPPPQYTFVGELNSIRIWYGLGKVPKTHETKHDHPGGAWREMQAPGPSRHSLTTPPACFGGKTEASPPTQKHCISLYATSAMDGVPFLISDKYMHVAASTLQPADILGTAIKSLAEIEQEYEYSFHTEDVTLAGLPSSEC
ncbi:multivesicular body subunit 12B-like isoform X3 [Brienomyrus brachyistius]|uniref:multivesicular body subunit 12B-like isoform X3 n=1 Tax=Brienomyrus brachyistius TaxID=42636 RepID=UPI0020B319F1|nr:multivesicular body subunit 12B-like isoform X3 [Brienomyrus brachyistius]